MGVTDVCDLRRDSEVERIGRDRVPSRVTVHRLPFDYEHDAPHEAKLASTRFATDHMLSVYSEFPVLAPANQAIVQIATLLANGSSLLVHCGAGKDRAGWAVATILTWVGVCEEDIVEDYLTSNTAIDELKSSIESGDGETTDSMLPLLRVQDIYLRRSFDRVDAVYGSFEAYADHIGLTRETLSRLEDELLDS
jgi:protein-tyrosine phosphatase